MKIIQLPLLDFKEQKVLEQSEDIPKTYKGLYAMHKYWAKKPYNLVANYIERFSAPNDIVIDSFCGSGVTLTESVRLKRRAIGIDINPIAIFITKMGLSHVDIKKLKHYFNELKFSLCPIIDKLYHTECLKCGNPAAIATHIIWEKECPQEIWYVCDQCKTTKGIKLASEHDRKAATNPQYLPGWYPSDLLIPNSRINAKSGTRICDLFTNRALVGLSLLFEKINQIPDKTIKSVMLFCFSATLPQASNLVFVIRKRGKTTGNESNDRPEVGSWVIGYWVPTEHFEIHTWRCFENRFRRILRGKQQVNSSIPPTAAECSSFEELYQQQEGYWVSTGTATKLTIPSDTIDYAFVDPPHGNRIPYLELSLIWNSWFGSISDWENEIIISEARSRQKNIIDYQNRLSDAFNELWRVLKSNKFLSVAFNSLNDDTWLSMLNTCLAAGFEVIEIKPLAYSARSVVQDNRKNALKTDFVITCKKQMPKKINHIEYDDTLTGLRNIIFDYLTQFEDGAETYQILNHLLITKIPTGSIFKVSRILTVLESEFVSFNGRWLLRTSIPRKSNGSQI
jgi:16S rRNA G966 N2-methylase RsmD